MTVHISRGVNRRYIARVRRRGCRRYTLLGEPMRSRAVAFRRLSDAMNTGDWKRGDVLLMADYYDPTVLVEMVAR